MKRMTQTSPSPVPPDLAAERAQEKARQLRRMKAIALGASAVMVGRPQMHALAVAGMLGVAHMLHLLRAELELAMAQTGCATLADIGPQLLVSQAFSVESQL